MTTALHTYDAVGGVTERRSLNDEFALAVRPPKPNDGLHDSFGFLPYPFTANCGVHRELWCRLGGFDEKYHHGCDDVEFFWRVQLSGAALGFAPKAVVHYRLRSDIRSIVRQAYDYGRSDPMLFRGFRAAGMPPSTIGQVSREWWWIVAHSPALLGSRTDRAMWLRRVAVRGEDRRQPLQPHTLPVARGTMRETEEDHALRNEWSILNCRYPAEVASPCR